MVATVNLETYSDADFVRRFVYRTVGGVPIDLGTNILRMMVRSHAKDATVHLDLNSKTEGEGITITDAAQGAFTVFIPTTALAALVPGVYEQSMILTDTAFQSRLDIWRGTLTHRIGPTRWKPGTFV
jgi:hypothetical protein